MSTSSVPPRSICVVGAGAIGGLLGVHLSRRGHRVTFLARGKHLAAMKRQGNLRLSKKGGDTIESGEGSRFVGSLQEAKGEYDVVILGLKTHQIGAVLDDLGEVVGENTTILTTQNGIPWWFFQRYGGPEEWRDRTVEAVDPGGRLKDGIDPNKLVGMVVYPAAHVKEGGGEIIHVEGIRFPVGDLEGGRGERVVAMADMLVDAGFKSPVLEDVRGELWLKLWGTVAVNPLSALTHATLDVLCTVEEGRDVVMRMMREVEQVALKMGSKMRVGIERRVDGAAKVGKHKTSMLQDVESGKEMEIETIMGAVRELAAIGGIDTPCIDTVYGTVKMLAYMMKKENSKVVMEKLA